MQIYQVGGAVRDALMGFSPKDKDYVVVGATAAQMLSLGFTQVGADFPVFLHPQTADEYALARTERKAGTGYHGFLVNTENVSLEEDLSRRDLTINAMAMDGQGAVLDPHGGRADLYRKVLRHVGPAFSEDPLRVLRVARFWARLGPQWSVAPETLTLMAGMVRAGDLDDLTPERIWKEVSRGLMEPHPGLMLQLLHQLGVFELEVMADYRGVLQGRPELLAQAATAGDPLEVRFALAFPRVWDKAQALASRVPVLTREVAHLATELQAQGLGEFERLLPDQKLRTLERMDPYRQVERVELVLRVLRHWDASAAALLARALERIVSVDVKAIARDMPPSPAVGQAIRQARLAVVDD